MSDTPLKNTYRTVVNLLNKIFKIVFQSIWYSFLAIIAITLIIQIDYREEKFLGVKYGYEGGVIDVSLGSVVGLISRGRGQFSGSPYELNIRFGANEKVEGKATVTDIKIFDDKNQKVFEYNELLEAPFEVNSESKCVSNVMTLYGPLELDLKHVEHTVIINFEVTTPKKLIKEKATLFFRTELKEYSHSLLLNSFGRF
jgi:hypothetical protein